MKISPLDSASFMLWPSRGAHPNAPHSHHPGHHADACAVHRPEHADHRRDCDDRRDFCRRDDACSARQPRLRYDEYLGAQNLREHDRFESCRGSDRRHGCSPVAYERPGCGHIQRHHDTRDLYDMPKIGDVSQSEFNRAVERAVQTYLIRAITNVGSAIDLFA